MFSYWLKFSLLIFIYNYVNQVQGQEYKRGLSCRDKSHTCMINIDVRGPLQAAPMNGNPTFSTTYSDYRIQVKTDALGDSPSYRVLYSEDYCTAVHTARHIKGTMLMNAAWSENVDVYDPSACCHDLGSNDLFSRKSQIESFNIQFEGSQRYITQDGPNILVPNDMMPQIFLGYSLPNNEAASICYNMVPMFKLIRNGDWRKITEWLKSNYMTESNTKELQVNIMRGGSLTVPDSPGTVLHLHAWKDENGRIHKRIPIPEYLAIVVTERSTNRGYVYVILNNPFITIAEAKKRSIEICGSNVYVTITSSDTKTGYNFACDVKVFFQNTRLPYPSVFGFEELATTFWWE